MSPLPAACRAAAALSLSALLLGCASAPPPATLLALPSLAEPGADAAPAARPADPAVAASSATASSEATAAAERPVLVVRRLQLPEYLLARRVRFRAGDTTVDDWPAVFWAERIEVGMTRELTAALRARLPGWALCNAECSNGDDAGGSGKAAATLPRARSLRLELAPLDYRRDRRELVAVVRGTLDAPNDGAPALRLERRYVLQADADTPQAHAAVLGELLRRVAADAAPLATAVPTALAPLPAR